MILKKALYGLRMAPRWWAETYSAALVELGWTQCPSEPMLWKYERVLEGGVVEQ